MNKLFSLFILLFLKPPVAFALVNGLPLEGLSDVVRIRFTNGWACSGVFLDPYTLLTAAHCFAPNEGNKNLRVDKIESANNSVFNLEIKALLSHPNYSAQSWHSYDIGIIKTSKNLKFEGHFQLQENFEGYLKDAFLMGCGRSNHDNINYSRTWGENTFLQVGSVLFFLGESGDGKSELGLNVSIAPNDSGGPILEKATNKIVGIMTTTTLKNSHRYGIATISTGTSTTVKENLQFIKSNLGE